MWVHYLEAFSDFCHPKSQSYRWVECPGSSPSPLSGAPDLQQHKSSRFSQGCLLSGDFSFSFHVLWPLPSLQLSCLTSSEDSHLTCRCPLFIYLPWPHASSHPVWGCGDQSPHSQTGLVHISSLSSVSLSANLFVMFVRAYFLAIFSLWLWMTPVAFYITPMWCWLIRLL